jgi:hypothetical protein
LDSAWISLPCYKNHFYKKEIKINFNGFDINYAPIYIKVGDIGNIEEVDVDHAGESGNYPLAGDNMPEFGGECHFNFSDGPAEGEFCWDKHSEMAA